MNNEKNWKKSIQDYLEIYSGTRVGEYYLGFKLVDITYELQLVDNTYTNSNWWVLPA